MSEGVGRDMSERHKQNTNINFTNTQLSNTHTHTQNAELSHKKPITTTNHHHHHHQPPPPPPPPSTTWSAPQKDRYFLLSPEAIRYFIFQTSTVVAPVSIHTHPPHPITTVLVLSCPCSQHLTPAHPRCRAKVVHNVTHFDHSHCGCGGYAFACVGPVAPYM